ncbi:heme ABC exporter ATP-binding protein CcmA [Aliihoeflea aestuarii]|jgi:heme exporter protein A|uniref:heme ABC exporter ATP-binding protein CcmA n=1 Tax=Aliihoeflea aestuarii TaxID=453840 RepID=UPI002093878A|nr:heme ABC exporter ATP-binding protein CcmA [Aliihoeflea aestuarii]MCO6391083.1 heme ABC exporter ATP-binding protein CcmA [Aliihoeflea aestuarii]
MRLIAEALCGERGGEPVFGPVDFALGQSEALVVTGENGSGKSTLLRVVAGLLPSASGAVRLEGAEDEQVASAAHYLGHQNAMKTALSVNENLDFWRDFHGEPFLTNEEALDEVGLADLGHLPFGYLSTGQRRRVSIAKLLVSYRPVWLLDEPTAGLDARSERRFAALMAAHLEDGGIIVAATHIPLGIEGATSLVMGDR